MDGRDNARKAWPSRPSRWRSFGCHLPSSPL